MSNFKNIRHRFVRQGMTISEMYHSKKSDIWMSIYRALSGNGHFLGNRFLYNHGNYTKKINK